MKCPFCQTLENKFLFSAKSTHGARAVSEEEFTFCQCFNCGSVFPRVAVGEKYYSRYYSPEYYRPSSINYLNVFYQKINLTFLKLITKVVLKKGDVLDFGCGQGDFLLSLGNSYRKFAVEINSRTVNILKKKDLSLTIVNDINDFKKSQKFDLVTAFHVLEHLPGPTVTVKKVTKKIKKGGYLIIATPNSNSLGFKTTGKKWFHLDAPRHLLIFNSSELRKILINEGFTHVLTVGGLIEYPLDLFWSWFNLFKTSCTLINFFLTLLIFPVSVMTKLFLFFLPEQAETFMIICRKN